MAVLDELLVGLGFDYDPKELDEFKKGLDKTVSSISALIKVAVAGAAAITALTVASTLATDEQGKLAAEVGIAVETIDALQFALRRAGGTADGMSNSLRNLAIRASEAARGTGSGVEAFGILGVSVTDTNGQLKSTADLMLEVSRRMQGLSKAQQIELADKLGIRDSVLLLQQGPKAIRDLIAEAKALGVTTADDAFIAEQFQDSLTDLWQIMRQIGRTISGIVAPILKEMVATFTDWWKVNRQIIEQNLPIWVDQFTKAIKLLTIAVGVFFALSLLAHLGKLVIALRGVSVAALLLNAAFFLIPILIALAAVAIAALAEDAKVFFEGGDSFIGDMLEKYPKWRTQLMAIATVFGTLAELTMMIFEGWAGIINAINGLSVENVKKVIKSLPGFVSEVTGFDNLKSGAFDAGVSLGGTITDIRSGNFDLGAAASNTANTVINGVEIFIQGGADTAENIADAVFNTFQQTTQDLATTVDQ